MSIYQLFNSQHKTVETLTLATVVEEAAVGKRKSSAIASLYCKIGD